MQGVSDMGNKYQNHYQIQINNILDQTQNLCIEKGIDNVSIVDIARSCHITHTTVYNYFDSKEDILWAIFYRHQSSMYEKCVTAIKQASTTYEKFQAYAYTTLSLYKENIYYPIFMDIFGSIYMSASAKKDYQWDNPYNEYQVKPGDMVALLSKNFHDGSVKSTLDPKLSTVSFVYAISSLIDFLYKSNEAIQTKYQLDFESVAFTQIQWLLNELKNK